MSTGSRSCVVRRARDRQKLRGGAIKYYSKLPSADTGGTSRELTAAQSHQLARQRGLQADRRPYGRISGAYADQDGYVNVLDYGCVHPSSGVPAGVRGNQVPKVQVRRCRL